MADIDVVAVLWRIQNSGVLTYQDGHDLHLAAEAAEELIACGSLLERALAPCPDLKERRALWESLGMVPGRHPTIAEIRREAAKQFAAALAACKPITK